MKTETWQDLEDNIEKILKDLQKTQPYAYQRFYDSRSAGNLLPAMPADFLIGYGGHALFLEAKFSEKHKSLRSCFAGHVQGHQTASATIWGRAKIPYVFLFYSSVTGTVEVWNGMYCAMCRSEGRRLNADEAHRSDSLKEAVIEVSRSLEDPLLRLLLT